MDAQGQPILPRSFLTAALLCCGLLLGCQSDPTRRSDSGPEPLAEVADSGVDSGTEGQGTGADAGQPVDGGAGGDAGGSTDAGGLDAGPEPTCDSVHWSAPNGCMATDVEGRLRCVSGLTVTPNTTDTVPAGYTRYDLTLVQQVDVAHADAGTFTQSAVLLVVDPAAPLILSTSGYHLSAGRSEPARIFRANQLSYEHRFFGPSTPSPADWSQLTIRQAADDAHGWASALKWIFPGKWANTGASKGGMTSLYHRRFHPCDVDATIAYVAPTSYGEADPGYAAFLKAVGGPSRESCRQALGAFQRKILTERAQVLPLISGSFVTIPIEKALELAAIELPFAFWQYVPPDNAQYGCAAIPGPTATPQQMVDFLSAISSPNELAGEQSLQDYAAYYYQAQRQLGAPAPFEDEVPGLLQWPRADLPPTYFPPGVPIPTFEPQAMVDINTWISMYGERIMLIYGEFDPWSTHMIPLGNAVDSISFVVPGGNHGSRLGVMPMSDQAAALARISRWLNSPVVNAPMKRGETEEDQEPLRRYPR